MASYTVKLSGGGVDASITCPDDQYLILMKREITEMRI